MTERQVRRWLVIVTFAAGFFILAVTLAWVAGG